MNQLENCQARYRSNTWMGRTRTDGPDEFEPSKFDCMCLDPHQFKGENGIVKHVYFFKNRGVFCGSFLLFMYHVCLYYTFLSVRCRLVITC